MRVKIQIVFALARVWNCQFMAFLNPYDFICRWIRDTCYLNIFPWLWVGCLDWLSVAGWFTAPLFLFSLYILHICYTLCFSLILAFEESFFVCRRRHNGHFSLILSSKYEAILHSKSMKLISFAPKEIPSFAKSNDKSVSNFIFFWQILQFWPWCIARPAKIPISIFLWVCFDILWQLKLPVTLQTEVRY